MTNAPRVGSAVPVSIVFGTTRPETKPIAYTNVTIYERDETSHGVRDNGLTDRLGLGISSTKVQSQEAIEVRQAWHESLRKTLTRA